MSLHMTTYNNTHTTVYGSPPTCLHLFQDAFKAFSAAFSLSLSCFFCAFSRSLCTFSRSFCMFNSARSFNQDLSTWNLNNVTDTRRMFFDARAVKHEMSMWNVDNVANISRMFHDAGVFNKAVKANKMRLGRLFLNFLSQY